MVNLTVENKVSFEFDELEIKKNLEDALEKLGIESKIIIELLFVDKEEIASLNKEFRQKDGPTDVLSFPQEQFEAIEENILGSIVICPEIAIERSESTEELVKHSLLHLLGHDHETDETKWDEMAKIIDCNF